MEKTIENIIEKNKNEIEKEKKNNSTLYIIKPFETYSSFNITKKGIEKLASFNFPKGFEYMKTKRYYGKKEQEQGKTIIEILNAIQ